MRRGHASQHAAARGCSSLRRDSSARAARACAARCRSRPPLPAALSSRCHRGLGSRQDPWPCPGSARCLRCAGTAPRSSCVTPPLAHPRVHARGAAPGRRAVWPHELQHGNHVVVLVVLVVVVVVGAVVVVVVSILLCERYPPPRLEDGEHEHLRNTPTSAELSAGWGCGGRGRGKVHLGHLGRLEAAAARRGVASLPERRGDQSRVLCSAHEQLAHPDARVVEGGRVQWEYSALSDLGALRRPASHVIGAIADLGGGI
eukprot:scaffold79482_cov69-Phaeocystis_antarctica.AAC.2